MGTPGKYTCCIAENEENHPWEPWHVERGFKREESTVTLVAASSMIQCWNYGTHEQLLRAVGDALSFLGSIALLDRSPGCVIFGGEHAECLRASGWGKQRIREFVVAHTGRRLGERQRPLVERPGGGVIALHLQQERQANQAGGDVGVARAQHLLGDRQRPLEKEARLRVTAQTIVSPASEHEISFVARVQLDGALQIPDRLCPAALTTIDQPSDLV